MNVLKHILVLMLVVAIANPLCCCFNMNDESHSAAMNSCCSGDKDNELPNSPCPCEKHVTSSNLDLEHFKLKTLDSAVSITVKIVNLEQLSFSKIAQDVKFDSLSLPPPKLANHIIYGVFRT